MNHQTHRGSRVHVKYAFIFKRTDIISTGNVHVDRPILQYVKTRCSKHTVTAVKLTQKRNVVTNTKISRFYGSTGRYEDLYMRIYEGYMRIYEEYMRIFLYERDFDCRKV